ncbi:MAG: hypothetical protein HY096_00295 [Nitrospinae bacterium]|nr:hypothetical protein [Nitrospinota bacterium]
MAGEREITLKISAEASQLNSTLNEASRKINRWAAETGDAFKNLEHSLLSFTTRIAAIAAPFAAVGAAFGAIAQKTANAGDELLKTSQQIGISVEKLSGLKYAAELSNANLEALTVGVKNLSKNITEANTGTGEARDIFKTLGIEFKDANGKIKSTDEILLSLADKFSNMEDGAGKTALALKVFGRNGLELLPFLNKGRDGLKELTNEARETGNAFTTSGAESATQFNDEITKLKKILEGLVNSIGKNLIPMFNNYFFPAIQSIINAFSLLTSKVISGFMGALEMTGSVLGGWAARVAAVFDWVKSGFKGGFGELKKQFEIIGQEVDKELERIAFKWSGKPMAEGPSAPAKKKTAAPVIIDSEKLKAEREKTLKEVFEKEKKYNAMLADNWQKTTKRLRDEDEKYRDDRIKLRDEELKAMIEVEQKQLDINNGLKADTLKNQMSLMSEEERLDAEYELKKIEMEKAGITDMMDLYKWYYSEIEVMRKKAETKPDSFLQKIQKAADSLGKALTGSSSSTEGLGAMVSVVVDLIKTITDLPKLLNTFFKEIFTNLKHFPRELVNLIKDVLVNLPNILLELIITVITELIPVLVSEIPNMIIKMVSGLFEAIKTLIFGGEIKSTIDGWTNNVSNQSVTVQLDTSNAMQALKYAQDALLGAVNETDRKVAREALLSARQAAILAEQKAQEKQQQTQTKTFKGLFGYLGELFENIFKNAWEGLKGIFTWAWDLLKGIFTELWDKLKGIFTWAWDGLRGIVVGLWNFLSELPNKIWDGIKGVAGLIGKAIADAWEGIKNALGFGGGSGGIGGVISGVSNFVNNAFHGFGLWHDGGLIKAHSGLFIDPSLKSNERKIIVKVNEGILNDYNGMKAIGGETGLNFANRYGYLPNSGKTETNITQHVTQHFQVVVDKDGNVMKLTRIQARNLARTLNPMFKEMQRNGELSFA